VEHRRAVSNEEEFEYWLASAFESERKRLHEGTPGSHPNPTPENVSGTESKKEKGDAAAA